MPTSTNIRYTDLHPFTPDSTLKLTNSLSVSPDSVLWCRLFPVTSESANCAHISSISRSGGVGVIQVNTGTGAALCTVSFPIDLHAEELVGTAVDVRGLYCGTMTLRSDWIPLFYGSYKLPSDSLKLLPSACRLLVIPANAAIIKDPTDRAVLMYEGRVIRAIHGDGKSIKETADGTLYLNREIFGKSGTVKPEPVKQFAINGKVVDAEEFMALVATGGGLDIAANGNEIVVGAI